MKISFIALIKATVPAIFAFLLLDTIIEYIISAITGISFLSFFEQMLQTRFGIKFYILNFIIFSTEMLLVMFFYAVIRTQYLSNKKPIIICTCFFIVFVELFLAQMINLGIYPVKPALMFGVSTIIGFPFSVFTGAAIYERLCKD